MRGRLPDNFSHLLTRSLSYDAAGPSHRSGEAAKATSNKHAY